MNVSELFHLTLYYLKKVINLFIKGVLYWKLLI